MMESGGLVYMLGSLHWALQQLQPRLSGSCRDVAEGRESGERSLGGLPRGQPPYGSSVHRHQIWKVTWPKCKPRRVPNRKMMEYGKYMKTSYCVSIPFHPIPSLCFFQVLQEKPTYRPARQEQLSTAQSQARIAKEAGTGWWKLHGISVHGTKILPCLWSW